MIKDDISLIVIGIIFACLIPVLWKKNNLSVKKEIRFIALFPLFFLLFFMMQDGFEISMLPTYIGLILLTLDFIFRDNKKVIINSLTVVILCASSFGTAYLSKHYRYGEYSREFEEAINDMKEHYILMDYKEVDLDEIYERYLPSFIQADRENSEDLAFNTWSDITNEIQDGHVYVTYLSDNSDIKREHQIAYMTERLGLDYGFLLIEKSNGDICFVGVTEDTAAYNIGIRNGMKILSINGEDIECIIDRTVPYEDIADPDNYRLNQVFFATSKLGERIEVSFIDEGGTIKTASLNGTGTLYARYNEVMTRFMRTDLSNQEASDYKFNMATEMVNEDTAILYCNTMMEEAGTAFVKYLINKEDDSYDIPEYEGDMYQGMKQLLTYRIQKAKKQGAKNLIIDLRNNGGGYVLSATALASLFSDKEEFVYADGYYDEAAKAPLIYEKNYSKAENIWGDGQIVILVNSNTASAAEIFAYFMQKKDNVTIVGFTDSVGAAQAVESVNYDTISLCYSMFYTLNEDGSIMIDAKKNEQPETHLDIKVPLDDKAFDSLFNKDEDYLIDYVINNVINK